VCGTTHIWVVQRQRVKQCYDKPTVDGCLSKKWGLGANKQLHCCISYLIQVHWCAVCKHKVQIYFWSTPLTRISIDVADSSVLPVLFLRSLSIWSVCHIVNICVDHQGMKLQWFVPMAYHPHTGFHYSKLLIFVSHNFRHGFWVGMGISKCLCVLKTFSPKK